MNIGLDFGTTNTVISYEIDGEIKYLTFDDEDDTYENLDCYLLPSAVYLSTTHTRDLNARDIWVGKLAYANRFSKIGNYFSSMKGRIATEERETKEKVEAYINEIEHVADEVGPSDVAEMIMMRAFRRLLKQFSEETYFKIMLTVPVEHSQIYIEKMLRIIRNTNEKINEDREKRNMAPVIFDINGDLIINEPIAAVIACKQYLNNANNVLVVDLGGGTLDVAIVKTFYDKMENISIFDEKGRNNVGGNDFDEALTKIIVRKIVEQGTDVDKNEEYYEKIEIEARKVKEKLQRVDSVKVDLSNICLQWNGIIEITYKEYSENKKIMELQKDTCDLISKIVKCFQDSGGVIHKVLLVGGMARERFLYKYLEEELKFSKDNIVGPDSYDTTWQGLVSRGAAILNRNNNRIIVSNTIVSTIGVLLQNGSVAEVFKPESNTRVQGSSQVMELHTTDKLHIMKLPIIEYFGQFREDNYTLLKTVAVRIPADNEGVVYAKFSINKDRRIDVKAYPKNHEDQMYECEILF